MSEEPVMKLTLTYAGRSTQVPVDRSPWSCHPKAGTVDDHAMRSALRRIKARNLSECQHDARELWAYHGGYFVGWETA